MIDRVPVYIAHPLSAPHFEGMAQNRLRAARWCAWAVRRYRVTTIADWVVLSSVLAETPENRAMGIECDLALIPLCRALWLVGGRLSSGMAAETEEAQRVAVPVIDLLHLGAEPPALDVSVRELELLERRVA